MKEHTWKDPLQTGQGLLQPCFPLRLVSVHTCLHELIVDPRQLFVRFRLQFTRELESDFRIRNCAYTQHGMN